MNSQELKQHLLKKPSYFKESYLTISNRFSVPMSVVYETFDDDEIRKAKREYNNKTRPQDSFFERPKRFTELEQTYIKKQLETLDDSKEYNIKQAQNQKQHTIAPGMHIVIGCLHVPFENKKLVKALGKFISDHKENIAGFHIIGDFLDLRSLSFHDRGKIPMYGITLGYEYKKGNEILDYFDSVLPSNVKKSYIYGNHEDRHTRLGSIADVNQYIDALPSPKEALRLEQRGYLVKDNWKEHYIQIGKLQLMHGIFCTSTPAKTHLNRIKTSVMFAHTHRIDSYYETNHGAFNIGCMAEIDSDAFTYLSRVERLNWRNGIGLVHLREDGHFQADIINCQDNTFFYAGQQY